METVNRYIPATGLSRTIGGVVFLLVAAYILYYLYTYFFSVKSLVSNTIITSPIPGNTVTNPPLYDIVQPYKGGEYSVSFWIYITAFKDQIGSNKHILELRGSLFSTLVVGLGAFTNKLLVRVQSNNTTSGTTPPNPEGSVNLSTEGVENLFRKKDLTSSLMSDNLPLCDLPEVELQKWVNVSIVLNSNICDVYLNGKLARSCILPSFFRVDPNGELMKLLDFGGFDGYLSDVNTYSYALNPEQTYRIYMTGPSSSTLVGSRLLGWLKSLFNISGTLVMSYPNVGVTFPQTTVSF